jgi:hypothetical protein
MAAILLIDQRPAPEIRSALALAGHDVVTPDALAFERDRHFDLALVDVAEGPGAEQVITALVEKARAFTSRVVLLIETYETGLARLARACGASGYINRLGASHLLERVQYYLPR